MNVAVIGKSKINSILKEQLESQGFEPLVFENVDDIEGFSGEKGKFTVKTCEDTFEAAYVIVTQQPAESHSLYNDMPVVLLDEAFKPDSLQGNNGPVVILLDHPSESLSYMTGIALDKAIKLARKKVSVIYMARFIRTAGSGLEELYKKARNSGVTFIKYSDISLNYNHDTSIFNITANDGYGSIDIQSQTVLTADREAYSDETRTISEKLRLKLDKKGLVNEDRHFLFPTLTNREGVYFINSEAALDGKDLPLGVEFTISAIKNETNRDVRRNTSYIKGLNDSNACEASSDEYAEIDAGKCAFCYTCYRACPSAAMTPDYQNSVMKNLNNACLACGICVSVCPADAVKIKTKSNEKQEVIPNALKIYCCKNSGEIAVKKLTDKLKDIYKKIDVEPVSCGGQISVELIISSLKNYKKTLVLTCMDEACKHFDGNKRAFLHVEKARDLLKAAGMDEGRVQYQQLSHAMPDVLKDCIEDIMEQEVLP